MRIKVNLNIEFIESNDLCSLFDCSWLMLSCSQQACFYILKYKMRFCSSNALLNVDFLEIMNDDLFGDIEIEVIGKILKYNISELHDESSNAMRIIICDRFMIDISWTTSFEDDKVDFAKELADCALCDAQLLSDNALRGSCAMYAKSNIDLTFNELLFCYYCCISRDDRERFIDQQII